MSRGLQTRLAKLEAQRPAVVPVEDTPYVHPLSPPSERWWTEFYTLITELEHFTEAEVVSMTGYSYAELAGGA